MLVRSLLLWEAPRYIMFPSRRSRDADPGRVMPKYRDSFMGQIELEPVENSSRLTISVTAVQISRNRRGGVREIGALSGLEHGLRVEAAILLSKLVSPGERD